MTPFTSSVSLSKLLSLFHQVMGIRIVPTSQGYYPDHMIEALRAVLGMPYPPSGHMLQSIHLQNFSLLSNLL